MQRLPNQKIASACIVFGVLISPGFITACLAESPTTIFFDNFDTAELDRTKWNVIVTREHTYNGEQQAYVDSPEVIHLVPAEQAPGSNGGALIIQAKQVAGHQVPEQGRSFEFISGRLNTQGKVEVAGGTIAARMKLPAGSGLWPAFWMLGSDPWPECGEIDIMECVGETDWAGVALHGPDYSGETPLVNKFFFTKEASVTDWHVYSVDWSPEQLLFKIDDRLVYRVTRPMVENYGEWKFDDKKFLILNLAIGGAYPAKTNGIKEPRYGLPDKTVQLIKAGKAKVLVDWVRITQ